MARKHKKGFDYFTLDTVFTDSVRLSSREIGNHCISILIELWQKIYGQNGYYCNFDEDSQELFLESSIIKIDIDELKRILDVFFKRGVFSKEKYEQYQILTSDSIQERFIETCNVAKRKSSEMYIEYLCIDVEQLDLPTFTFKKINSELIRNNSELTPKDSELTPKDSETFLKDSELNTHKYSNSSSKEKQNKKNVITPNANEQQMFEQARVSYLGSKSGLQTELDNFVKKYPNEWQTILPLLLPAIAREKIDKAQKLKNNNFNQQWKNFSTWINQKCWEIEYPNVTQSEVDSSLKVTTNSNGEQKTEIKEDRSSFPMYQTLKYNPELFPEGTESRCGYWIIKNKQCVPTHKY